jgi:hypothetical protein
MGRRGPPGLSPAERADMLWRWKAGYHVREIARAFGDAAMSDLFELSNGDISMWIEQEASIHLRASTKYGDPVELSSEEARELAKKLMEFAQDVE